MLGKLNPQNLWDLETPHNTSICIFDVKDIGDYKIEKYNCIDHLNLDLKEIYKL